MLLVAKGMKILLRVKSTVSLITVIIFPVHLNSFPRLEQFVSIQSVNLLLVKFLTGLWERLCCCVVMPTLSFTSGLISDIFSGKL